MSPQNEATPRSQSVLWRAWLTQRVNSSVSAAADVTYSQTLDERRQFLPMAIRHSVYFWFSLGRGIYGVDGLGAALSGAKVADR